MAERELKVKFTGDTKGLQKSLTGAQKAVKSTGDTISKAGKAIATGVAAGAAAAVAFGVKSVDTYKNVGGEVLKLQRYTGDTAENASRMRAAFKLTGIDTDKAARSFGIFSKNIAAGKIDKLGINLKDVHGQLLPFDQALGKVADKIASMPPGTARTALAIQAFGKAGTDMLPFLSKGSKGILELANQSDKLGTTLSGKDIGAIKSSKEESRKFGLAMEGLQIQIGRYVLPVLTDLTRWATEHLIPALDRFGRKVRDWLVPHLEKLSDWWDTKGHPAFDRFVKWIKESLLPVLDKVAKDIVDKIVGSFQKMVDWMAKHPKWAQPILDGFIAMIAMIALTNLAFTTSIPGLIITLFLGLYILYRQNKKFAEWVDKRIWEIKNGWGQLAGWLAPVVKTIGEKWSTLIQGIKAESEQLGPMTHKIETWFDKLRKHTGTDNDGMKKKWDDLVWGIRSESEQFGPIASWIAGTWSWLKARAGDVVSWLQAKWSELVQGWRNAAEQFAPIGSIVIAAFVWVEGVVGGIVGWIETKVDELVQGLKDNLSRISGLLSDIQKAGQWLSDHNPLNIGGHVVVSPTPVPTPHVPALAAGGLVRGTAHGTLVLAGENNRTEVVSPVPQWLNRGNGGNRTYNINVTIPPGGDSLRAGRDIVKAIKSWEQVAGSGWRAS